jgi:hypothetical protein
VPRLLANDLPRVLGKGYVGLVSGIRKPRLSVGRITVQTTTAEHGGGEEASVNDSVFTCETITQVDADTMQVRKLEDHIRLLICRRRAGSI